MSELIEDIAMGPFGSDVKVDTLVDEGIPFLSGSNVTDFKLNDDNLRFIDQSKYDKFKKAMAKRGDIIITHRGTLGQIVFIPETSRYPEYIISQSQFRVRVNEKVIPQYLVYFFHSRLGQHILLSNASRVGVPALARPTTTFKQLRIPLPDLETQNACVRILDSIQNMIEVNTRINDYLVQISNALYDRYFPYSVYDDLPDGWKKTSLGQIIEIHDSKRIPLSAKERSELAKIYPYYGAASITDYVNDYIFDGIYLLLGEDGTVINDDGSPVLQYVFGKFWVNNHAHILTGCKGYSVDSLFLLCQRLNITSIVTGAVQPKISQSNLRSLPIVQPPIDLVESFSLVIKPLFDLFRVNSEEIKLLTKIRNQLITELFRGSDDNK